MAASSPSLVDIDKVEEDIVDQDDKDYEKNRGKPGLEAHRIVKQSGPTFAGADGEHGEHCLREGVEVLSRHDGIFDLVPPAPVSLHAEQSKG